MDRKLLTIVNKLNENLPDESMFSFGLITTSFWSGISIFYMNSNIPIWDNENDGECTYSAVLGKFQEIVIELMKIAKLSSLMKEILSRNYTDLLMLEDESWQPDTNSINASIANIQEIEDVFEIDLEDTRI